MSNRLFSVTFTEEALMTILEMLGSKSKAVKLHAPKFEDNDGMCRIVVPSSHKDGRGAYVMNAAEIIIDLDEIDEQDYIGFEPDDEDE